MNDSMPTSESKGREGFKSVRTFNIVSRDPVALVIPLSHLGYDHTCRCLYVFVTTHAVIRQTCSDGLGLNLVQDLVELLVFGIELLIVYGMLVPLSTKSNQLIVGSF